MTPEANTELPAALEISAATAGANARLKEILLVEGVVTEEGFERAEKEAAKRSISLRDALTGLGIALEDEINWSLSRELQIPFVLLTGEMLDGDIISRFPVDLLFEAKTIPIPDALGGITLVMENPLDEKTFQRVASILSEPPHRAVGPSGRINGLLEEILRSKKGGLRPFVSESVTKDSSGVAAVYGMVIAARRKGANRILMRPAGDGLETAFRLERGWVTYKVWSKDQSLAIISRTRIMLGLDPGQDVESERASITTRINSEKLLIEGVFNAASEGQTIDLMMYPVLASHSFEDLTALSQQQRQSLISLFSSRRPTGLIVVNAPDQRQRYRMIYSLNALLLHKKLDVISIEERKFLDIEGLRRYEIRADSPAWDSAAFQECDVLAICEAPFWRWKDFCSIAGERLIILGVDLVNSWLAFRSLMDTVSSPSILADRLRALWSARRVDLTCGKCGGVVNPSRGTSGSDVCDLCDGYGRYRGTDLFEALIPDEAFREALAGDHTWERLRSEALRITIPPTIESQLYAGIEAGTIFNASEAGL